MRIHIAGGLTTQAFEIGQALAGRLGLDYLSAPHNFKFPVTYTEDTESIMQFWNSHEDCVVNALSIPIEGNDDAVHILLERDSLDSLLKLFCTLKMYLISYPVQVRL